MLFVPPWAVHGTVNLSHVPARFEVVGQPGAMTGYFAETGVLVSDESTPPERDPPDPPQLREIAPKIWHRVLDRTSR
jgi:hypothetical protein